MGKVAKNKEVFSERELMIGLQIIGIMLKIFGKNIVLINLYWLRRIGLLSFTLFTIELCIPTDYYFKLRRRLMGEFREKRKNDQRSNTSIER